MDLADYQIRAIDLDDDADVADVRRFLAAHGFDYDAAAVDETLQLETVSGELAGVGSRQGNVLKFVCVAERHRETAAAARLVTALSDRALRAGHDRVFVFTRPTTARLFAGLGFSVVATAPPLFALLEFGYASIADFQKNLAARRRRFEGRRVAGIVVNCNPFTRGHRHLVETAAAREDTVYVFVVEEDRSLFPFSVRFELVRRGLADLGNVEVLAGGPYIVSSATFPTYFLKSEQVGDVARGQAELDATIFAERIAPPLGIARRYVGTEPTCATTAAYNAALKRILPPRGVDVAEVPRLAADGAGDVISASKVRRAIWERRVDQLARYLPDVTRAYLSSEAARPIIRRIQALPRPA